MVIPRPDASSASRRLAEKNAFEFEIEDKETRDRLRAHFVDMRMPRLERARLGARANAFGSKAVIRKFGQLQGHALAATLVGPPTSKEGDAQRIAGRVNVAEALAQLEDEIRRDLGTDTIAP